MFGTAASETQAWEESLDHRLLEEELDLQLSMLKDHQDANKDSSLFPEVEAPMEELPHLKDQALASKTEDLVHQAEATLAMEETVLEESTLEGTAICGLIALIAFAPNILHV